MGTQVSRPVVTVSFSLVNVLYLRAAANNQCATHNQYCCQSVQKADSPGGLAALAIVSAVVDPAVSLGITCSGLNVLAASSNSWQVLILPILFHGLF